MNIEQRILVNLIQDMEYVFGECIKVQEQNQKLNIDVIATKLSCWLFILNSFKENE